MISGNIPFTRRKFASSPTSSSTERARGGGDRLGPNARNAGNELGGGVRVDLRGRGGRASDGKAGNGGRGRKEEGGGGHRSLAAGWFFGSSKFHNGGNRRAELAVCYLIVAHHNLTLQCRSGRKITSPPREVERSGHGRLQFGRGGRIGATTGRSV